jgi:hypothetical protein
MHTDRAILSDDVLLAVPYKWPILPPKSHVEIGISAPLHKTVDEDGVIRRGYDVFYTAYLHFPVDNLLRETRARNRVRAVQTLNLIKDPMGVSVGFMQVAIRNLVLGSLGGLY